MVKAISNLKFWNFYYKNSFNDKNSSFSKWALSKINNKNDIIDIGCGNGRDSFFFSKYFKNVYGADKSKVAINKNITKTKDNFFKNVIFHQKDFSKKKFYSKKKFSNIYARFFLHALNYKEEFFFLSNLKKISKKNSLFFLEFRTIKDPMMRYGQKISKYERVHGHYRRFINTDDFIQTLKNFNFEIMQTTSSNKFSVYRGQKPHLARILFKRK